VSKIIVRYALDFDVRTRCASINVPVGSAIITRRIEEPSQPGGDEVVALYVMMQQPQIGEKIATYARKFMLVIDSSPLPTDFKRHWLTLKFRNGVVAIHLIEVAGDA